MPINLSYEDRRLLGVIGGLFGITLALAWMFSPSSGSDTKEATSYSAASEGTKAAYLLLRESGYSVERWERSPAELGSGANSVLFVLDPTTPPGSDERKALRQFVDSGGTLVFSGRLGSLFTTQFAPTETATDVPDWQSYPAVTPSLEARQAPQISLKPTRSWSGDAPGIALYGDDRQSVVMQYPQGAGQVIWLGSSTLLSNGGMKQAGNMEFLLAVVGNREQRVLWDEYFHGYRAHETTAAGHPQMRWLFGQLGVLAFVVLITFSRRSGPVRAPAVESRLSPLEFVQALGQLYARAQAANVAVDIYYGRFRFWLTRKLGMNASASPEELARAVQDRWRLADPEFLATLKACESARFYHDLPRKEAQSLVEKLYRYASQLKLFPSVTEEKT
jgi:Domain of unknown function (DUF4350)